MIIDSHCHLLAGRYKVPVDEQALQKVQSSSPAPNENDLEAGS